MRKAFEFIERVKCRTLVTMAHWGRLTQLSFVLRLVELIERSCYNAPPSPCSRLPTRVPFAGGRGCQQGVAATSLEFYF